MLFVLRSPLKKGFQAMLLKGSTQRKGAILKLT